MAFKHIAVFAILGAAYVAWTALSKRKEAAAKAASENAAQSTDQA